MGSETDGRFLPYPSSWVNRRSLGWWSVGRGFFPEDELRVYEVMHMLGISTRKGRHSWQEQAGG